MPDKDTELLHAAAELLGQCRTASLATTDADGNPHAASIQYVHDDKLRLYYISGKDSAHSQHLAVNPRAALTIYHHEDTESKTIRGLQIHALADTVTDRNEHREVARLYKDRFPFVKTNPIFLAAIKLQGFYRLTPTWLRLVDNRKRFGWKGELELSSV
jgi:uncharacterized protein